MTLFWEDKIMIRNRQEGLGESFLLFCQLGYICTSGQGNKKWFSKKNHDNFTTIIVIIAAVHLILTIYQVLC